MFYVFTYLAFLQYVFTLCKKAPNKSIQSSKDYEKVYLVGGWKEVLKAVLRLATAITYSNRQISHDFKTVTVNVWQWFVPIIFSNTSDPNTCSWKVH